jgi:hypothetical protein
MMRERTIGLTVGSSLWIVSPEKDDCRGKAVAEQREKEETTK